MTKTTNQNEAVERVKTMLREDPEFNYRALKGKSITVVDEDGESFKLKAGSLDRKKEARLYDDQDGFALLMGEIKTKSGHRFHALLRVNIHDSGEFYGACPIAVYEEDGGVAYGTFDQDEEGSFDEWVGWMKEVIPGFQMFPFKYRYKDTNIREIDHHVGADGWSKH